MTGTAAYVQFCLDLCLDKSMGLQHIFSESMPTGTATCIYLLLDKCFSDVSTQPNGITVFFGLDDSTRITAHGTLWQPVWPLATGSDMGTRDRI